MPHDEYQFRFNDPGGQILPLLWLGGCVLCLWFAAGATVVVALVEWNLLLGMGVGLGGAILGILASSFLAVAFPQLDARYLRLGPLAAIIEFLTLFAGAIVVVLVGLRVFLAFTPDMITELPSVAEAFPPATGSGAEAEAEECDLFDVLSRAARGLWLLALVPVVGGFLLRLGRSH
jgi:hypothetical protein